VASGRPGDGPLNRLRVLLTNNSLARRNGSGLYLRDIALALLRRGHRPVAYSPTLGELAAEIRGLTIPVVSDLGALGEAPDVIHGQHHYETMTALLHFPRTPAISFCHGWLPWQEAPPAFPRIARYVAVDDLCRERLVSEHGVPAEKVVVLLNFVDLDRFRPRRPLPPAPRRALVFSNDLHDRNGLPAIRAACAGEGLEVDVVGIASRSATARPEDVLPRYDLVFAKGRAALEALAVGCAVVVCDARGLGGMVTLERLAGLRRLNFGIRTQQGPLVAGLLATEIRKYSEADAALVSAEIRRSAALDLAVDELIGLYGLAIDEFRRGEPDPAGELRAAATYLRRWSGDFKTSAQHRHDPQRPGEAGRVLLAARGVLRAGIVRLRRWSVDFRAGADPQSFPTRSDATMQIPPEPGLAPVASDGPAVLRCLGELPLTGLVSVAGDVAPAATGAGVTIRTIAAPWHHAALLAVSTPGRFGADRGFLRLRVTVRGGPVGVGLLRLPHEPFLSRQALEAADEPVEVLLPFRRLGDVAHLVFQTWDQPVAGVIEVAGVDVCVFAPR
jgi:hypothetical protein